MINIRFKEGNWEVWTDCEDDPFTGHCIGASCNKAVALSDAILELENDTNTLKGLLEKTLKEQSSPGNSDRAAETPGAPSSTALPS